MNTILYITIFIIGTLFGSFYTLAVYRIPRKIDIVKTHSFCPNCKHKLGFFELIPVLSYIALGGKCRKCGRKIRPRYLILEILSGCAFVFIAFAMRLDMYNFDINLIIQFAFFALYFAAIFLIGGVDKENRQIEKSVIYYALVVAVSYIIYLCIIDNTSIYRYAMYLITLLILLIADTLKLKRTAQSSYTLSILTLLAVMAIISGEIATIVTIISALLMIAFTILGIKLRDKINKVKKYNGYIADTLSVGYYLCLSNVISFVVFVMLATR